MSFILPFTHCSKKVGVLQIIGRRLSCIRELSSGREAHFMNKIMGRNKTKSKVHHYFDRINSFLPTSAPKVHRPINQRRIAVLNKLFMKNITEVLATGSTSQSIEGLGIEISKVAITPDFQNVNVLFVCKTTTRSTDLDRHLVETGFTLRHELSKLNLMGEVPRINFIEDKRLKQMTEVQELLAVADKGNGDDVEDLASESCLFNDQDEAELLKASQRAYGLDHTKIMNKVMASKRAATPRIRNNDAALAAKNLQQSALDETPTVNSEPSKRLISAYLKEIKAESKQ